MRIITLASGSNGNCYLIKDREGNTVVLDAGINFEKITSHPEFPKFSKINLVFITHTHSDHNKSIKDFKRSGCEVLSYENLEEKMQNWDFKNWSAVTFNVLHNVPCWGIVLKSKIDNEKLCYMTDFYKSPIIENCENFLYEVNYVEKNINAQIDKGRDFKHTNFTFHNSLENAKSYFEKLETRPKEITICHLSKDNGDYKYILKQMSQFADIVNIAEKEKE